METAISCIIDQNQSCTDQITLNRANTAPLLYWQETRRELQREESLLVDDDAASTSLATEWTITDNDDSEAYKEAFSLPAFPNITRETTTQTTPLASQVQFKSHLSNSINIYTEWIMKGARKGDSNEGESQGDDFGDIQAWDHASIKSCKGPYLTNRPQSSHSTTAITREFATASSIRPHSSFQSQRINDSSYPKFPSSLQHEISSSYTLSSHALAFVANQTRSDLVFRENSSQFSDQGNAPSSISSDSCSSHESSPIQPVRKGRMLPKSFMKNLEFSSRPNSALSNFSDKNAPLSPIITIPSTHKHRTPPPLHHRSPLPSLWTDKSCASLVQPRSQTRMFTSDSSRFNLRSMGSLTENQVTSLHVTTRFDSARPARPSPSVTSTSTLSSYSSASPATSVYSNSFSTPMSQASTLSFHSSTPHSPLKITIPQLVSGDRRDSAWSSTSLSSLPCPALTPTLPYAFTAAQTPYSPYSPLTIPFQPLDPDEEQDATQEMHELHPPLDTITRAYEQTFGTASARTTRNVIHGHAMSQTRPVAAIPPASNPRRSIARSPSPEPMPAVSLLHRDTSVAQPVQIKTLLGFHPRSSSSDQREEGWQARSWETDFLEWDSTERWRIEQPVGIRTLLGLEEDNVS